MNIRYLKHDEIDFHKWDSCVHYTVRGNPYAYSWYLNNICETWDGIVEDDYVSVMPIVWNDKIPLFPQLFQPQFAQQLGMYSVKPFSEKRMTAFLNAIPPKYKRIHLHLNAKNKVDHITDFSVKMKDNLQLFLSDEYDTIYSNYSNNLKRSLKKAEEANLVSTTSVKPEALVELFKNNPGKNIPDATDRTYATALRIIYNAMHRGLGFLTGIRSQDGELLAAAFFLSSHGRIINLLPASSDKGRSVCAMHLLIDLIIRTNSPTHKILDFEGSSIESIARFYKGFGAGLVPFPVLTQNTLPFFAKWFIK